MDEHFELPAELTIYTVQATRSALLGWLAEQEAKRPECLLLDAQGVQEVDGAGVQLLGALAVSLSRKEISCRLVTPSAALVTACRSMGLGPWLDLAMRSEESA